MLMELINNLCQCQHPVSKSYQVCQNTKKWLEPLLEVCFFHSSKLFLHPFFQYDTAWCRNKIAWAITAKNVGIFNVSA